MAHMRIEIKSLNTFISELKETIQRLESDEERKKLEDKIAHYKKQSKALKEEIKQMNLTLVEKEETI